jgi:PAS domain S-box-containing protein/putative nucleotidyltransferase with HDIG domain
MVEKARIMVVEDEAVISMEIQDRLTKMGHSVCGTAASGEEAVSVATAKRPDLILMDVQLRGEVDGVQTAKQIRDLIEIPIIYLTAFADDRTVERAKLTQPFGYLIKPFSEKELYAAIEMALYKNSMEVRVRDSERRYATTIRCIADCVIVTDTDMKITLMNPAAQSVTGWKQEEAVGKKLDEVCKLVEEKALIAVESPMVKAIQERVVMNLTAPVLLITKNGDKVPVEDSAAPMINEKGELTGAVMVFRDITWRKEAEEAIKMAFNSLEARVQEQTAELRTSFDMLGRAMEGTIQALATMVEARDRYTAGHQVRVADLACMIARQMGVTESRIPVIRIAALIHDVGKVCVPTEILNKPAPLSPIEFEIVKQHPKAAYDVLSKIEFPWAIADIVLQHHERVDGSGYPSGLRGDQIHLEAQIIGVADVVEAMSSHRPYRAAVGTEQGLEEISKGKGTRFNPAIVDACIHVFHQGDFKFKDVQGGW